MRNIFILLLVLSSQFAFSAEELPNKTRKFNLALSANFGTYASGIELHTKPADNLGLRIGIYDGKFAGNYITNVQQNNILVEGELNLSMFNFMLDFFPVKNSVFRITSGFAINNNRYYGKLSPINSQKFGLIVYSPERLGNIEFVAKGNKISPYIGIGFGNSVPKYKLGLGLDLGLFYQDRPNFIIIGNGSFKPSANEENTYIMDNAFKSFAFFPFFNFSVKYRLIK
jgi:hypothetical protein